MNMSGNLANQEFSLFTDFDIALFKAGKHYHLYNKLGAHRVNHQGRWGAYFAVWAPNARYVSVVGNFNSWNSGDHPMQVRWDESGIWEVFIPDVGHAEYFKYYIEGPNGYSVEKGDPYAFHWETPPQTASVVWDCKYSWNDTEWMQSRQRENPLKKPISVYELHIGSWRKNGEDGSFLTYREIAGQLPEYCVYMGFTHVEFMPVMEHPFFGSWGYQLTGYFAPSSRFGTPEDFMYLVDQLHLAGIGVILDWVPSHFPVDEHGLGYFDGTPLYEYADPRKGFHPDWKSNIFNLERNEVREFLISNAFYWLDKFHIDGLRVDAVASMLYLDYSRNEGEWIPNIYGGRENLEAISFLQEFNEAVHSFFPDVLTIAEESTSWPGVTQPVQQGGLGFDMKWMMGWMHDSLNYFQKEPVYRRYHHGQLTFSLVYAFSEKFCLPLSHDEVVHGKASLINKMPGDAWQKAANLRLLYAYMYGHPGAKLIFMGGEFAQAHEWQHDYSLDWHENHQPLNRGIQLLLKDLNELYKTPAMHQLDFSSDGFCWIDCCDADRSILSWIRKGERAGDELLFVANFTPEVRHNYRLGVHVPGFYEEILNSDNLKYGGSDVLNEGELEAFPVSVSGFTHSLSISVPPLGISVLKFSRENPDYIF
ncbi:1,4-alpha-glucan branching enzyme [Arcticibacter pallidicorallinus]|uniref:1,4-alpha-glucan branching enzyme GlgB n=2 Tax=Arcticibacter pallidicorallinus TaxID=1259464 RepID=A0A2T0U9K2_9SPHI|nr:1,4-alpha-glucan branching protein GlgB [Arcticibacter pallidicorallinus]PRY54600.1 1,4-alpha-glucan branching enzyme [Arcticibacter pallidicorallinus]